MEARGVEKFIGAWTRTRPKKGGLGLASAEWGGLTQWMQNVQKTPRRPERPVAGEVAMGKENRATRMYTATLEAMGMQPGGDLGEMLRKRMKNGKGEARGYTAQRARTTARRTSH